MKGPDKLTSVGFLLLWPPSPLVPHSLDTSLPVPNAMELTATELIRTEGSTTTRLLKLVYVPFIQWEAPAYMCPAELLKGGFGVPVLTSALWGQEVNPAGLRFRGEVLPHESDFSEVRRVLGMCVCVGCREVALKWQKGGGDQPLAMLCFQSLQHHSEASHLSLPWPPL